MRRTEPQPTEEIAGRFTGWFRNRPTSHEYWELVVGEDHLGCCFAGESFSSLLLRTDMGESTRHTLDDCVTVEACIAHHERNFTVELSAVTTLRLREGTRARRARLTVAWDTANEGETSWKLSKTGHGESEAGLIRVLEERDALKHADVGVEAPGFGPF